MSKKIIHFTFLAIFITLLPENVNSYGNHNRARVPALYVLGDSLFDSGNNNRLPTIAKANYLPYGINYVNGVTGRFTNGRTVADFIAEYLRLPHAPPIMRLRGSTPLTGINYASGSCGIITRTGSQMGMCMNLNEQIDLFEKTVTSDLPKYFETSSELSRYLAKSLFVMSMGSNDFILNYLSKTFSYTNSQYSSEEFAQYLVDGLAPALTRLYELGARKIIYFEVGPVGCVPYLAKTRQHTEHCYEEGNKCVLHFNAKLGALLKRLTATLRGSVFVIGKINGPSYDAVMNPNKYGIKDSSNSCCKALMNGTSICMPWVQPCDNPNEHYFFDGFHPTEGVYATMATQCIRDRKICSPFNIAKLVKI